MSKRKRKSVVVIGEGIPGTDLIRRYKVTGNQSIEIEPVYVAPLPVPHDLAIRIVREARQCNRAAVVFRGARIEIVPPDQAQHLRLGIPTGIWKQGSVFRAKVGKKYLGTFKSMRSAARAVAAEGRKSA